MTVRLATRDDADRIAIVLLEAFIEFRPLYTPCGFSATTPDAHAILERWEEGPVWIALIGGTIIGTVAVRPLAGDVYVRSMATLPDARGMGAAHALLMQVERFARKRRAARLFLSTTPFLADAIRLYEKFGFTRIDEGPFHLFETPLFTMEKRLIGTVR